MKPKEHDPVIGEVVRFISKNANVSDDILIQKFGSDVVEKTKDWCKAILDFEKNKDARMKEIIDEVKKNHNNFI